MVAEEVARPSDAEAAEAEHGAVAFSAIHDDIRKLGRLAHANRQNALRIGVKRAGMPHLFHVNGSANNRNHIMGGESLFFVNIENTVQKTVPP